MKTINPNLAVIEARRAAGAALLADLTLNADLDNEMRLADMKVEYGFARHPAEFGQLLPEVWTAGDGRPVALYKVHNRPGLTYEPSETYFNMRGAGAATIPVVTLVADGH